MNEKNFCVMRFSKLKSPGVCQCVLNHMHRCGPELYHLSNPGAENWMIKPPDRDEIVRDYGEYFEKLLGDDYCPRKNCVYGLEFIMSFSPAALKSEDFDLKDFCKSSMKWLSESLGGNQNIVSAVVHNDEKTPHIHALVIPTEVSKEGKRKLNSRSYINGKKSLRKLQDTFSESVEHLGLSRGRSREITQSDHISHLTYHRMQLEKEKEELEQRRIEEENKKIADSVLAKEQYANMRFDERVSF